MFKYYISEVEGGGGSRPSLILLMRKGRGVQDLEKYTDVILKRSLRVWEQKVVSRWLNGLMTNDIGV